MCEFSIFTRLAHVYTYTCMYTYTTTHVWCLILQDLDKNIFAKRGGGWTTTHLYVHCTFVITSGTYEMTWQQSNQDH